MVATVTKVDHGGMYADANDQEKWQRSVASDPDADRSHMHY